MKKTASNRNLFLAIIAITYIAVIAIAAIIGGFTRFFFEGLACLTFGAVVAALVVIIYGAKGTTIKDVFFHAPIYVSGGLYYLVSGAVAALQMFIGIMSLKVLLVVQIVLFVLFLLVVVSALISMNTAKNTISKAQIKNEFIRNMAVRVENIAVSVQDRELKIKLEGLAEEFKYSKPIAHADLAEVETRITAAVGLLENTVATGGNADESIQTVKTMLAQRNNAAKLIK